MLERELDEEKSAVEARFRALVAEWDLGRTEAAALLGVDRDALGLDLVPGTFTSEAERRLRLLVEIRGMLPALVRDARDVPLMIRERDRDGPADERGEPPPSMLTFMSGPIENVCEMRRALVIETGRRA